MTQQSVQNLHQISILSSILSSQQYFCLSLVSLLAFMTAKTEANCSETPTHLTCQGMLLHENSLDNMTHTQGSQRFFIGKRLVCGVGLGLFQGPCIFTALLWRSSHFVLVVSACARAKQNPKGEGVGGKFQLCAYGFRMGWPFVCFFLAWRTGIIFSFAFSSERRQGRS